MSLHLLIIFQLYRALLAEMMFMYMYYANMIKHTYTTFLQTESTLLHNTCDLSHKWIIKYTHVH